MSVVSVDRVSVFVFSVVVRRLLIGSECGISVFMLADASGIADSGFCVALSVIVLGIYICGIYVIVVNSQSTGEYLALFSIYEVHMITLFWIF